MLSKLTDGIPLGGAVGVTPADDGPLGVGIFETVGLAVGTFTAGALSDFTSGGCEV